KHSIAVSQADGRGAEQNIDVVSGKARKVTIALPKAAGGPGTVSLLSDPSGARVYLDEQRLGQTPYTGEVPPGAHKIMVELQGFVKQEREVTFREGHDVELSFSLAPLPKDPALSIESVPAGATVTIDGKQRGVTPWLGSLEAGRHQVVLKKAGQREIASDFEMPEGRDMSLRLELPAAAANAAPRLVVVSVPEGAKVKIDGAEVGETPWAGPVKPGQHELSLSAAGFTPELRKVEAKANREMEVSFALQRVPGPGKLIVATEPAGAEVSVDGKPAGASPITVEVQPGEHDIEASKAGFKSVAQKISVDHGQSASLRLALAPAGRRQESIIAVATDPKGARLYVDGRIVGETPVKVKSRPGQHEIRVALDGYITRSAKVVLPPGKDFELRVAVSLKKIRSEEVAAKRDEREIAKARLKRAQSCDKQGDWDCALKQFQAVYDYKPVPELLFNIAQVRRKKGDFEQAANAYRAYLQARPTGQLADRARQLAEKCEAVVKGGDKNIAEDDTEPPVIKHEAVAKALRNAPLRLTATITDNQSGVFNPQACWRNVYNTEYECAPLVLTGQDTYSAEVPAKATTDGFAYFIEAFDNASNGPARSGAPEVPHSVAMEDPAPPPEAAAPMVASAVQQATSKSGQAAEGVAHEAEGAAEAAPADEKAVAAGHVQGQGAGATNASMTTGGGLANSAKPAGSDLANSQGGSLLGNTARSDQAERPWLLLLHLGAEQAVERYTDSVIDGRIGLELSRRVLDNNWLVFAQLDARTVRQPYRAGTPVPGQVAPTQGLDEQRYSVRAAFGYDFGGLLVGSDRLTLAVLGAADYQRWQNNVFPANYFGFGAQVQARFVLASPFSLVGGFGYTWNVLKNTSDNAVGTPKSDLSVRAGVEFQFTPRYSIEAVYRSDVLALANDYRFSNGLSVGFGTTF
ncbi:MAG TPA: PEGA domain-containing protein, partial [Solirubrobacterales bacterium]|nr:PEGA domain-containing protein [Solirubrobacterales bacterium]